MLNGVSKSIKMKNSILIFVCLLFMIPAAFAGGPWTKTKGSYYLKLSEWWTVFDQHFTDNGFIDPNVTTGVFNTSIYGEYGLTGRWNVVANIPVLSRNYMNNVRSKTTGEIIIPGDAINTIGDIDLGVKYGILQGSIPVSASLYLGLPSGTIGGGDQGNLQTGDGEFNQMIQVDAGGGFSLGNLNAYAITYLGFNNRTKEFSEELRFGAEIGLGFLDNRLWINARLVGVESLKNGATAETVTSTSIFANNTEYISLGSEIAFYLTEKIGLSVGAAGAFRGEIIAAAPSYNVGIFIDINK